MVSDDPADTAEKISDLPDDILLDILGRLVKAGDVRTAASTSTLSRRWSHLPWPEVPDLSLDVGSFFADSDEWSPVKGRHRFWEHHRPSPPRFLAAPPSRRVIQTLRLTFILTRRDYVRRIGDLVVAAADTGAVRGVELEIVTETTCPTGADAATMVAYSERFTEFREGCPGAFRRLTKLHLRNLWFEDEDALIDLVRGSVALESWALFLLEASPRLESLDIRSMSISDHICRGEWREKRDENTNLTWKPSPDFMHHNLKKLSFQRAFNMYKDMGFARLVMELAVNLETLTFGVKTLEFKDCVEAEPKFPDPARSRLRLPGKNEHVDAIVKKLKDGISTSVQITIHLPD